MIELSSSPPFKENKKKESIEEELSYLNVGIFILVPILVGLGVGYYLDNLFKTKPLFIILLLLLGIVSSFYNLWRLIKKQ